MAFLYLSSIQKKIAVLLLLLTVAQISLPTVAWALTSGPAQPEFSGFQPVGVTDMVNKFTGDFSYSVPVMEVPGPQGSSYPITLAYHSGANSETDASWVGYGWDLNTGAINRSARGLPDDLNNQSTTYYNKIPRNYTLTAGGDLGVELFSKDHGAGVAANLAIRYNNVAANLAIRYNNYTGFGYNRGLGISLNKGLISLGLNESDGRSSYSASINPMALILSLRTPAEGDKKSDGVMDQKGYLSKALEKNLRNDAKALGMVS